MRRDNRKIRSLVKVGQKLFDEILKDGHVNNAESFELMSYADNLHRMIKKAVTSGNPEQCYMAYTTAKVMIDGLEGNALAKQAKKDGYDPDMVLFLSENVVDEPVRSNPRTNALQDTIARKLEDLGFPSIADGLRTEAKPSDYIYYIEDLRRARRENSEEELPTQIFNQAKSLLDEWFLIAEEITVRNNPSHGGRNLGDGTTNGGMAKNQLRSIKRMSVELHDAIRNADELPDWVLSKITVAQDRISVATDYILSKLREMELKEMGHKMNPSNIEKHIKAMQEGSTGTISMKFLNSDGSASLNNSVVFDDMKGQQYVFQTDRNGKITESLPVGVYEVTINADGRSMNYHTIYKDQVTEVTIQPYEESVDEDFYTLEDMELAMDHIEQLLEWNMLDRGEIPWARQLWSQLKRDYDQGKVNGESVEKVVTLLEEFNVPFYQNDED